MNIREAEKKREELITVLTGSYSPRRKLFAISYFIENLLTFDNLNLVEANFIEFLDEYIALLKIFEPSGLDPSKSEKIISVLDKISAINLFKEYEDELADIKNTLYNKFQDIVGSLSGKEPSGTEKLYFPVTEYDADKSGRSGFIENISIKISSNKSNNEDSFFIIPSSEKIEKRLFEQIKNSWDLALKFVSVRNIKIEGFHDVIISFNKKYGEYVGNSLGLVLTLGMIEELLGYYKSRDIVKIKEGIAITGSADRSGSVIPLSDRIISSKVEIVFFSTAKFFVVPKGNENFAVEKLKSLQIKYPKRNLKIIEVGSVYDLIDRRTLIDVSRINFILYTGRKLKKAKYLLALIIILSLISGYLFLKDYDDNPSSLEITNNILFVKNKYGNTIWQTGISYPSPLTLNTCQRNRIARIVDINKDGKNEVVVTNESSVEQNDKKEIGRIACYDYSHKLIWKYVFRDSIATRVERFTPYYSLKILAVNYDAADPVLLAVGQHENFYPSPIIKVLLRNGKRIGKIFWHPGGGSRGFLSDINNNGKDELVADAISNGLERTVLYSIEYDKLEGTAPTTPDYRFLNQPIADFDQYIILPKTDVNSFFQNRYNYPGYCPIITYDSLIYINIVEAQLADGTDIDINYNFDKKFRLKKIIIGDKFRVVRDSLVARGKIKGPYTETPEYKKYLWDQIKYWNGSRFVAISKKK